jgi:hypothetical protein
MEALDYRRHLLVIWPTQLHRIPLLLLLNMPRVRLACNPQVLTDMAPSLSSPHCKSGHRKSLILMLRCSIFKHIKGSEIMEEQKFDTCYPPRIIPPLPLGPLGLRLATQNLFTVSTQDRQTCYRPREPCDNPNVTLMPLVKKMAVMPHHPKNLRLPPRTRNASLNSQ